MVLTNFECWAHGETADAVNFESGPAARNSSVVDPFNARVVSHIASASNGYYGYAIVNNEAAASDNNNNSCNNNNIQAMQVSDVDAAQDTATAAAVAEARCKKRCFAMGHHEQLDMEMDNLTAVKRCRFDDADLVAQYCNDFFSLPATQMIGTQACLMDYDYGAQQPQQVQQQTHQQQQHEQQQQQQHPRIYQHYQGHLHRTNRDTAHNENKQHSNESRNFPKIIYN